MWCLSAARPERAVRVKEWADPPTSSGRMISYVERSLMIPSWWMPDECAKAFDPTIALFLWMESPMRAETILLVFMISFVLIPVRRFLKISFRVWIARTTSSRAAFPARSPIPFMVTSACLAPARIPASVLAVAIPRSLWQCMERTTLSSAGTFSFSRRMRSAISWGVAYPTVSGTLIVFAPAFTTASTVRHRKSKSVRAASSVENSTSGQSDEAYLTVSTHHWRIFFRSERNFFWMWMSDVPRKVWIRDRFAPLTASHNVSMSFLIARASPVTIGPLTSRATAWTDSKSPGEEAGKPASMISTPSAASCRAIFTFCSFASFAPGTCSPSRSVVSKMNTFPDISSSLSSGR